jgi:Fe2+ transport system protein FeoA
MNLKLGDKIKVIDFDCGYKARHKFSSMGITKGTIMKLMAIQLGHGPYTFKIKRSEVSIGRGMIEKLIYEVVEE